MIISIDGNKVIEFAGSADTKQEFWDLLDKHKDVVNYNSIRIGGALGRHDTNARQENTNAPEGPGE